MRFLYLTYLLFIILLNLNYFFKFEINKLPSYFVLFLLILFNSILLFYSKKTSSTKIFFIFYFVIFIFLLHLFRFDVFNYITHLFYIGSLAICFFHVFLTLNSNFKLKNTFFPLLIKYVLRVSLLTSIIGLYTKPFMSPGWIWPVNIALQEIILISLFFSEVIFFQLKGSKINFLLFFILVIFRESGKATLFALSLFLILDLFSKPEKRNVRINFLFKGIWVSHFIFIFISFLIIDYVQGLEKTSLIRYFLIKRFVYIQESVAYLSDSLNSVLGGGFGPENYFAAAKNLTVYNAPQLLPLTILVFGGLIFYILYVFLATSLFNFFKSNSIINFYYKSFILCISIIMTFHEYFVNPFVYISIGLVIVSYKSVNCNYEL